MLMGPTEAPNGTMRNWKQPALALLTKPVIDGTIMA